MNCIIKRIGLIIIGLLMTSPSYAISTAITGQLQAVTDNPTQRGVAEVIECICPPGNLLGADLQNRCNEIAGEILTGGDVSGALNGLQAMGAEEDSLLSSTQVDSNNNAQVNDIGNRQAALRSGLVSQLDINMNGQSSGIAAGDGFSNLAGWNFFITGNYGTGDKDTTSRESGFDMDSYGLTVGADTAIGEEMIAGMAFGYTLIDADVTNDGGKLETDSFSFLGYASYFPSTAWYVDGVFGYTHSTYDQDRRIVYTIAGTPINQTAFSDTDSDEVFAGVTVGYDFYQGNGWTIGPYGKLNASHVEIDGFTESISNPLAAGSGLAVAIEDQEYTSVTLALGGQIFKQIPMSWGDLYPQLTLEYVHEFDNDNAPIVGRFVDDTSATRFSLPTDEPDRDYANVGIGATASFGDGQTAFFNYQGLYGYSDLNIHAIEIGIRIAF